MNNVLQLLGYDILNLIFVDFKSPNDIYNISLTCKDFNTMTYKFVQIIYGANHIFSIPSHIVSKFINLKECYLEIIHPDLELMKKLLVMTRINIRTSLDMINDQ